MFFGGYSLIGLSSAVLIAGAATCKISALETGPMNWIGRISYSLYLWHWPPLLIMMIRGYSGTILLLSVPIALVIATISFYLVEHTALSFKYSGSKLVRVIVALIIPIFFMIGILFVLPGIHR
jgi:peptidoglycan/LPS O-acetylase OafA/YrhL